jgi:DNA-binding LytR/AlgR family response regulator
MKTKCIIVDDEPLAIELIKSHLTAINTFEIKAECKNALIAMDVLHKERIDLMFLDIHMPQISGFDFLKTLKNPPNIIITTAYRDYALEGFEMDVVDYLVKPISFERFLKAINKFYERSSRSQIKANEFHKTSSEELFINVRENKTVYKINIKDIYYVEGFGEYLKIYSKGKTYIIRETMHEFESKLPSNKFLRLHKSFIISLNHIKAFTASHVVVNEKELPIGRSFKEKVFSVLNNHL